MWETQVRSLGWEDSPGEGRVAVGFSSYDGDFRLPLVLGQGSPDYYKYWPQNFSEAAIQSSARYLVKAKGKCS